MLRKTMIVLATAATFTGVLTADAFARGFGGDVHVGGGFTGGGFRAPIIRSAIPRPDRRFIISFSDQCERK